MQLAAIKVAAASNSSLVHRAAKELLPSAEGLRFAKRESRHSSPLKAQSCEQDADPWSSLVDPESPSTPSPVWADASSPPCYTAYLQTPGLMHAAQEPCHGLDTRQRPEQATANPELMTNPSSEEAVASQVPFDFKQHKHAVQTEFGGQQHHSVGSSSLNWELTVQQEQAASARQQLQRQLQESQQHLLHCQLNHKQRIAAAFGQAVKSELSDQLCEQGMQQPSAKLAAGRCQTFRDGSRAEQQEQQQKQLQLKCAKQAKHAPRKQKAGQEQDASAEAKAELGCNLGSMYQMADRPSGKLPDFLLQWMVLLLLSHL